jgi:hypothetical protein
MTKHDYRAQSDRAEVAGMSRGMPATPGAGWIGFAAILLGLTGTWNVLQGIMAIAKSRVYVGDETFVFSDLKTWGWIMLILGAIQLVASFAIAAGSQWARWFGIFSAGINMIGQLFFIDAQPWWAMAMFALDVLIIYGLAVYGGLPGPEER